MDELANKYIEQLNDLIVSDKLSEINSILESFTSVVSALSNKKKKSFIK
ncbi:hypothetical protein J7552_09620 [Wohlfahrtiimonas chitiniclastica]|nr:hypothetical protein [Wohlfahrtiimonas chitiniclastica]MBS7821531.1 hypothetical protein [Wohlfahrtiimonas chitiniclastica]